MESIDISLIWQIIITVVFLPFGFFLKRIVDDMKSLETRITSCQVDLPVNYVLKQDHTDQFKRITEQLDQIYQLLQQKQDK
jgi:hypothetical protein